MIDWGAGNYERTAKELEPVAQAVVVLSAFGVAFASDPLRAFREIARVVRPGGRVLVSAWVPAGGTGDP